MSYQIVLDPKKRAAGRFISKVTQELQKAFLLERQNRKLTQNAVANELGVNRSVVNRRLLGKENLTLRSIAELAEVLDHFIVFELKSKNEQNNWTQSSLHGEQTGHAASVDMKAENATMQKTSSTSPVVLVKLNKA